MDQQNELPPWMIEDVIDPALTDYSTPEGTGDVTHATDGQPCLVVDGQSFTSTPNVIDQYHPNYDHLPRPDAYYESVFARLQHPQARTFGRPTSQPHGVQDHHLINDLMLLDDPIPGPAFQRTNMLPTYDQPAILHTPSYGNAASLLTQHNSASPYYPRFATQHAPPPTGTFGVANISGGTFNLTINGNNGVNSGSGLQQSVSSGATPADNGHSHDDMEKIAYSNATMFASLQTMRNGSGASDFHPSIAGPSTAAQQVQSTTTPTPRARRQIRPRGSRTAPTATPIVPLVGHPFNINSQDFVVLACPALSTDVAHPRAITTSFTVESPPYHHLITLAQRWAVDQRLDLSRKYIFDRLPNNYVVAYTTRASGTQIGRIDRHVFGAKGTYRSPNELYPHLRWLAGMGSPGRCECKCCRRRSTAR